MKLRNKKTREIVDLNEGCIIDYTDYISLKPVAVLEKEYIYNSLAELNEEWEDYEEPKEFWYIGQDGVIFSDTDTITQDYADRLESIGNYFKTKEEAEKAVAKLKAWKRLKDKKFEFTEWYKPDGCEPFIVVETNIDYDDVDNKELQKDLDLLFSGGEE